MPKRSKQEVEKLASQAFELMALGCNQTEVAERLGVSTRTIQRWQAANLGKPLNLVTQFMAPVKPVPEIPITPTVPFTPPNDGNTWEPDETTINPVTAYQQEQEYYANQFNKIAQKLSPIVLKLLSKAEQNIDEIPVRLLPQFLKSLGDLTDFSAICRERSLGFQRDAKLRALVDAELSNFFDKLKATLPNYVLKQVQEVSDSIYLNDGSDVDIESLSDDELDRLIANEGTEHDEDRVVQTRLIRDSERESILTALKENLASDTFTEIEEILR